MYKDEAMTHCEFAHASMLWAQEAPVLTASWFF